eukprot:11296324-Alexandrium_andersonii.AAC.1
MPSASWLGTRPSQSSFVCCISAARAVACLRARAQLANAPRAKAMSAGRTACLLYTSDAADDM